MKKVTIVLSLVFAIYTGTSIAQEVGNPAPDFTLDALDGGSFTLSEQIGKLVVISAFGHNCSFCISSGPRVQERLVDAYSGYENYVVVGIDIWDGSAGAVTTYKDRTKMNIPLLLNGSSFATAYNTVQDRLFVVDKEGILIHKPTTSTLNDIETVIQLVNENLDLISAVENPQLDNHSLQVYPNPVIGNELNLSFNLSEAGLVDAKIISTDGRTILQPVSNLYNQGENELSMDVGNLSSGIYFVVLNIEGRQTIRKILID
jgi:peroxiredoxin